MEELERIFSPSSVKILEGSKDLMSRSQFECLNCRFLFVVAPEHELRYRSSLTVISFIKNVPGAQSVC